MLAVLKCMPHTQRLVTWSHLQIINNSSALDGHSGFVNAVIHERRTNAFLKQC